MRLHLFGHAGPGIGDHQHDIITDAGIRDARDIVLVEVRVVAFDGQFAPLGHGVPRIDGHVQQRTFNLPGIGHHRP